MAKGNAEKKPDPIAEAIEEELLHIDDEPLPAGATSIEGAIKQVLDKQDETYGVADVLLRKPYSTLNVIPEGMYAFVGNESGEMQASTEQAYIAAITDIGYGHHKNDDGFLVDPESNTVLVTDGVGGNKHGEVASAVGVHSMGQLLDSDDFKLEASGNKMHKAVQDYQINNGGDFSRIGATLVAAQLKDGNAEFIHAGDSKALMFRGDEIVYESVDDNLLNYIMIRYEKTKEEALEFIEDAYGENARPDAILQDLGHPEPIINMKTGLSSEYEINPHHHTEKTRSGDIILLASDGLTDNMDTESIMEFINSRLAQNIGVNVIAQELKEAVIAIMKSGKGKYDNITVAIIKVK